MGEPIGELGCLISFQPVTGQVISVLVNFVPDGAPAAPSSSEAHSLISGQSLSVFDDHACLNLVRKSLIYARREKLKVVVMYSREVGISLKPDLAFHRARKTYLHL